MIFFFFFFLQRKFNTDYQLTRKTLGHYGLPGHAHVIKIRDLSGGQKARVVFAELALMEPDILILVSGKVKRRPSTGHDVHYLVFIILYRMSPPITSILNQ